jgi:hypothetical protein
MCCIVFFIYSPSPARKEARPRSDIGSSLEGGDIALPVENSLPSRESYVDGHVRAFNRYSQVDR